MADVLIFKFCSWHYNNRKEANNNVKQLEEVFWLNIQSNIKSPSLKQAIEQMHDKMQ